MNKRLRFLPSVLAGFASLLVLASCSMFDTTTDESPAAANGMANISVTVEPDARTAVPYGVTRDSFTVFTLTATASGSSEATALGTWRPDEESGRTAYEVMRLAELSIASDTYTFVLTGTEEGGATYKATLSNTAVSSDTVLNFTLSIATLSMNGIGNIDLTYVYSGNTKASQMTMELYKTEDCLTWSADDYRINSRRSYTCSSDSGSSHYQVEDIPAGFYFAVFTFTDSSGRVVNESKELVWITAGRTSYSIVTIKLNNTFMITYVTNGGTLADGNTQLYSPLDSVTLAIPGKENLTFSGWYTSTDGGTTLADVSTLGWEPFTHAADITFYAKWIAVVSYVPNGSSTSGDTAPQQVPEGGALTLSDCAYTRSGYVFSNWNTAADGTGTAYEEGASYTADAGLVLYAQWVEKPADSVALTFKANGGEPVSTVVVESGATLAAADQPVPVKTGYTFAGWYTSDDDGETLSAAAYSFENITEDVTLYASWSAGRYTLTYRDAGAKPLSGELPDGAAETHTYGTATTLPVPVKAEYAFAGWYTDAACSGTALSTLAATGYTANLTLYAKWVRSTYYVSSSGMRSGDGSASYPLDTIARAADAIIARGLSTADFTIKIDGTLTTATEGSCTIDTTLTTAHAHSLTLRGATGTSTDRITGIGLVVKTAVPVTIADLTITECSGTSSYKGAVILINNSVRLTLSDGALITENTVRGVHECYGTLVMEDGAEISNNVTTYNGAGVYVSAGTFTMNGGTICENEVTSTSTSGCIGGAGVYVYGNASGTLFTMNGGTITQNSVTTTISDNYRTYVGGGGVFVEKYTFVLNGGSITENTVPNADSAYSGGGGVYLCGNTNTSSLKAIFTMNGGSISSNSAYQGGGVYQYDRGYVEISINGGSITNNTATYLGGGLSVGNSSNTYERIIMTGGTISGNSAPDGGGIFDGSKNFRMQGGTIRDNTAENLFGGGAVYVTNGGTFYMGDSAYIPAGADGMNNVRLGTTSNTIKVVSSLAAPGDDGAWATPVATIAVASASYSTSTQVVSVDSDLVLADEAAKFAVMPQVSGETVTEWHVGSDGKLAQSTE